MLELLKQVIEDETIRQALTKPELWKTLDVDYFPPRVERLYMDLADGLRIYLHKIHPTDQPCLLHKHRRPAAIYMVKGSYKMQTGHHIGKITNPAFVSIAATHIVAAGSAYEMTDPNGCHSVSPNGQPSFSIMVDSIRLQRTEFSLVGTEETVDRELKELPKENKLELLYFFNQNWPDEIKIE